MRYFFACHFVMMGWHEPLYAGRFWFDSTAVVSHVIPSPNTTGGGYYVTIGIKS
jgi:hypothetical protein